MGNASPYSAADYDGNIEKSIPFYSLFYRQTLDLVAALGLDSFQWLDCGCGTGTMAEMALKEFPGAEFVLCDPSPEMIDLARLKLSGDGRIREYRTVGTESVDDDNRFDVVTAIQSHHYFRQAEREVATQNCYRALKDGGIYIFFENTAPLTEKGREIVMNRWGRYQRDQGKSPDQVATYQVRYGTKFFPVTIMDHLDTLKRCGFKTVEPFWLSVMQAGFYAIK